VIVEDLHWSDASTRNLLMHTMRAAPPIPLLLVGTYRTDELTRRHPLRPFLAEVARLRSTDILELERLDVGDVAELIAETLGSRPPAAVVAEVYERCGGNPFLVEEVIAAGTDGSSGRLPPRLQDILLARTTSLSPQAAGVLRIAAVGGPRIDDALLRRVSLMAPDAFDDAVRELLDCHLLEPQPDDDGYVFRHALTAEAVYSDTLPGERVRLHTAFAHAIGEDPQLAATGGALAAVARARHWHRARHGTEALPAWMDAATAAERVHAHPEALAAYQHALELWPTIEGAENLAGLDEVELLRRAAEAANRAGLSDRATTLAQSAMALVDERTEPLLAAALNERLGRYAWLSGHEGDAPSYYQRALELSDGLPPSAERARALAGHAQILALNWLDAAAGKRAQEAIDEARRVGAVTVEAHAMITMAVVRSSQGDEAAALAAIEESARLTERSGDDESLLRLWLNRVYWYFAVGRLGAAAEAASQGCAVMRQVGQERALLATSATVNESSVLVDLGRFDEARRILDDALGLVQPGWWRAWALQAQVWLKWVTGDLDGAEDDLAEIQRLAPELTEGQTRGPHARAVAVVAIETEHWETAVQTAADAVRGLPDEEGHPVVHWETMSVAWLGLWAAAELTRERGDLGPALLTPDLADLDRLIAAAARRQTGKRTVRDRALLALCQAERGRVVGTASSLDWLRAVDSLDALGAVTERAYARVRLAEGLLVEGADRSDVTATLNEAVSLLDGVPRSPVRTLAGQVARRARLRLAERLDDIAEHDGQNQFGLTKREADVLRLLAEARTNREIGDTLFISPKTVSVHVSSIMRKLGVRRRADAARIARKTAFDVET
jgi:DNA-binding CsgD family transcriptional regulator/tetratricopeptide (TPR) repeat protein